MSSNPLPLPKSDLRDWAKRLVQKLQPALDNVPEIITQTGNETNGNDTRTISSPSGKIQIPTANDVVQVDTQEIVDAAIATNKLADSAATTTKIANLAVGSAQIADAAIVTAKIGDLAVTTAKIDDLAVNDAKIANLEVGKLTSGTIGTDQIYLGSNDFELDGTVSPGRLRINDGTYDRVELGSLVGGGVGIRIRDNNGDTILLSGSSNTVSGTYVQDINADEITSGTLSAATVDASTLTTGTLDFSQISRNALDIIESEITDGAVTNPKVPDGELKAAKLSVAQLSAITADIGSITAGSLDAITITGSTITGTLVRTSASGGRVEMDDTSNTLDCFNSNGDLVLKLDAPDSVFRAFDSNGNKVIEVGDEILSTEGFAIWTKSGQSVSVGGSLTASDSLGTSGFINTNSEYRINGNAALIVDGNNDLTITPDQFNGGNLIIQMGSSAVVTVQNDLDVQGTLSKSSGSFRIQHPHPDKSDKTLWHSFVESPTAGDNLYRYRVYVGDSGQTTIPLPDYWPYLNTDPQVWVSPRQHFGRAYGTVNDALDCVTIVAEQAGHYEVLVIGTRKDPDAINAWRGVEREGTANA